MSRVEIIILVVAAVALVVIIGWRAPDRSPGTRTHEEDID